MSENSTRGNYNPWQLWLKLCRLYNRWIESFFARLGEFVANYPLRTIFVCFLITFLLAFGFAFTKTENRSEKLYIPQNSESIRNLKKAKNYGFQRSTRQTEVIIINNAGANVLTKECFQDVLLLHDTITNIAGYTKLCLSKTDARPVIPRQCVTAEPLRIFNYSSDNFENLLVKLNDAKRTNERLFPKIFGKSISRNSSGNIISAKAIRLTYYFKTSNGPKDLSKEIMTWEKEFLDQMKVFDFGRLKCGPIFYTTARSLEDSISESTGSDIKLITLTFIIMISFACFMLGKYRNPLTGHGLLAVGGVFSVGAGIVAAFGLAMLCQTSFVTIAGLLPFLIIGVGIDDIFIIVDELDRTHPDQAIPKRISTVMKHAGRAISMTTMTDFVAFAIGTSSIFPSIVYFCLYAALTIAFAFFFLVTIFVAFMTYDCKRMNAGRRDIVPCLKAPQPSLGSPRWDEPLPQTPNKIMESWGKLLMKPVTKGVVVIFSIFLLGIGIYEASFINEEFDRKDLARDGSELIKYFDTLDAYFTADLQVSLVLESGVNYSDSATQQNIRHLSRIVADNQFYRRNVVSWLSEFQNWLNISTNSSNFVSLVKQFLESRPEFMQDIVFSKDNTTITASRLYCFIKQTRSSVTLRDAMTSLRKDLFEKSSLPVFASAYSFIFFEQYVATLPETIRNLALAAAAILVITSLFLVNPLVVVLVFLGFVALVFELLGVMYVWGVSLNSISMINLVMAVGFSVDYSAHVAHAFVFSSKANPEEKVIDALRTVGASVLMGGSSTFLGMVVTGFASFEIFRIFFKMFFGIVLLGLLHGLCFLPVWLAVVCRHHIDVGLEENDKPETTLAVNNQENSTISVNHENPNSISHSNELLAESNPQMVSVQDVRPASTKLQTVNALSATQLNSNENTREDQASEDHTDKTVAASSSRLDNEDTAC